MYLVNTNITVNWVLGATTKVIALDSLDIILANPAGAVNYIPSAIPLGSYLAPTETSEGFVEYTFTASSVGLWSITLTDGTETANVIYSESKVFVSINDTFTQKFVDGSLL